jgi:hypothetical protein
MPIRRLVIASLLGAAVITGAAVWWRTAEHSTRHASMSLSRRVTARDPISRVAATADGPSAPVLGLHMDSRSFSPHGSFRDASGNGYTIGEARRTDRAAECVVVIGPATSSACDEPRLFSRAPVMFIEGFEGGPAPRQRTGETVSGIAAPAVSAVVVVESNGARHAADFSSGQAFFFAMPRADLEHGIYLDHMEVLGASGRLIQTIPMDDAS